MSGNKFDDDSDLDQLAQDLDLDMDAPIGATFAAALRGNDTEASRFKDDEFGMDDDGFMTPPPRAMQQASPAPTEFSLDETHDEPEMESFESDFSDELDSFDPPPPPMLEGDELPLPQQAWLQPKPSVPSADDLPPLTAMDAEPVAEEDAAGQGLGYDYAFGGQHTGGDRPIPRITVHGFCARTASLSLLRTIMNDRRMKNVTMDVFEGGVPAAIQYYVNETTPNLLIIESSGDPRQLLSELDSLAEYCDENIRVLVLGQTNDIRLYRELMRRGVSEYLVAPIDPVQMIRSIGNLFTDPEAPFAGKTLAVTGVKGGVGASSIAHNLAWALSERCKVNATLVDLDLNFGTTGLDFNQDTAATIADALMSPDRFDDAVMGRLITKATDRLSLFTAPATLDRTYNLDPETYVRVLEQVRGSVPFVVLDLPHIWSDWFKSTVISADELIVVAGPDLASLRNGKNLIDFLKAARPNDNPPKLVLNMVGLPKRPEIPAKDFGQAIGIDPTMILPFDAQLFGTAANNGQMIFDVAPESKVAQGLDQLAAQLTGRTVQTAKPSMLKKLLGK
ncbi:MAG TPA: cellulose synthase operon protein YhjQ/BcsQ [Hyphomonadaceae bacterium]|nr:cellulose synthase operon protein YhjQ/BcsQ [Hyphomonadaceae bacterium]HPN06942.1 cellulose synthase operon protein YhjQ/BcsQ [Hyphomonadaceae bacterium]